MSLEKRLISFLFGTVISKCKGDPSQDVWPAKIASRYVLNRLSLKDIFREFFSILQVKNHKCQEIHMFRMIAFHIGENIYHP